MSGHLSTDGQRRPTTVVTFLTSFKAAYMTGAIVTFDGGMND
jgi:hypothetical protein